MRLSRMVHAIWLSLLLASGRQDGQHRSTSRWSRAACFCAVLWRRVSASGTVYCIWMLERLLGPLGAAVSLSMIRYALLWAVLVCDGLGPK